jgi:hypothetical protein
MARPPLSVRRTAWAYMQASLEVFACWGQAVPQR